MMMTLIIKRNMLNTMIDDDFAYARSGGTLHFFTVLRRMPAGWEYGGRRPLNASDGNEPGLSSHCHDAREKIWLCDVSVDRIQANNGGLMSAIAAVPPPLQLLLLLIHFPPQDSGHSTTGTKGSRPSGTEHWPEPLLPKHTKRPSAVTAAA